MYYSEADKLNKLYYILFFVFFFCFINSNATILETNSTYIPSQSNVTYIINKTIGGLEFAEVNQTCFYTNLQTFCNSSTTSIEIIVDLYNATRDTDFPIIIYKYPITNYTADLNYITINVTISDGFGLKNITHYLNNFTYYENISGLNNQSNITWSGLSYGIYHINSTACDIDGNCIDSETFKITLSETTTSPNGGSIKWVSKRDCNITIIPEKIIFYNNHSSRKVKIYSEEQDNITFYSMFHNNIYNSYFNYELYFIVESNTTTEYYINSTDISLFMTNLTLLSEECNDLNIGLEQNPDANIIEQLLDKISIDKKSSKLFSDFMENIKSISNSWWFIVLLAICSIWIANLFMSFNAKEELYILKIIFYSCLVFFSLLYILKQWFDITIQLIMNNIPPLFNWLYDVSFGIRWLILISVSFFLSLMQPVDSEKLIDRIIYSSIIFIITLFTLLFFVTI